jgi:glycosyltransferase involved in cell wall biosynthesis
MIDCISRSGGRVKTVLHLIPYDAIAGVETAARSMPGNWEGVRFIRCYLVKKTPVKVSPDDWHGQKVSENSPRAQWRLFRFALASQPDLVVASLWRTCIPLIFLQIMRPSMKSVLFLHSAGDVHLADWFFNRISMWRATEIWADSTASLEARVPLRWREKGRVLSFMTSLPPIANSLCSKHCEVSPEFVFWGRLHPDKNLPLALHLFFAIHRKVPSATLVIFGPDQGEGSRLRALIAELGLQDAVKIAGQRDHKRLLEEVRLASFYLQTSRREGMAMSVMEAMSLGLVPVVTPVGEIANYCRDGENAILVGNIEETAGKVLALLCDPERFCALSRAARTTWEGQRLYQEDFIAACNNILESDR